MNRVKKVLTACNVLFFVLICVFSCFGPCKWINVSGKTFSLAFPLSLVALPLFFITYCVFRRHDADFVGKISFVTFFLLLTSSVGMAFVLGPTVGEYFEKDPLFVVFLNAIKYAYDLVVLTYFCYMVSFVKKKWFCRFVDAFMVVWIVFGLFQCLVFYVNNEALWKIYDSLDVLKVIGGDSTIFARIRHNYGSFRFYGFASEPAENCIFLCAMALYFYWRLFECPLSRKKKIFYAVCLLFMAAFTVLTKSSSVYVGIFVTILGLFVYLVRENKISVRTAVVALVTSCAIGIILVIVPQTKSVIFDNLVLKLFNKNDYSTQHRYSSIWNDLMILLRFPLFGVGDGNQGYFYAANVSGTWMSRNYETQMAIQGKLGLLGGGPGIPAFISGFGVYGVVVLFLSVRSFLLYANKTNRQFDTIKPYLILMGIALFVLCMATSGPHRNYLLFLYASSPLAGRYARNDMPLFVQMTRPTERYREVRVTKYRL